jgi:hypothetical protein
MLGHQAVVMSARHQDILAEIRLHPFAHARCLRKRRKRGVARVSLEKPAHRLSAGSRPRRRRAGILQIGFEFNRRGARSELLPGDLVQALHIIDPRHELPHHYKPLLAQGTDLQR